MNLLRNKPLGAAIGLLAAAVLAWLAFGYFGIQAAFIDDEVNEAGPIFDATPAEQDAAAASEEFQEAMAEAEENPATVDEDMPDMQETPEVITLASGAFSGTSRYDVSGDALALGNGTDQRFLRFENFESSNGPDLKVYLRAESGDFVNLGDLTGNIGSQNYEIPPEVDLTEFSTVQIWCERFGVEFGFAPLGE